MLKFGFWKKIQIFISLKFSCEKIIDSLVYKCGFNSNDIFKICIIILDENNFNFSINNKQLNVYHTN